MGRFEVIRIAGPRMSPNRDNVFTLKGAEDRICVVWEDDTFRVFISHEMLGAPSYSQHAIEETQRDMGLRHLLLLRSVELLLPRQSHDCARKPWNQRPCQPISFFSLRFTARPTAQPIAEELAPPDFFSPSKPASYNWRYK